MTPLGNSYLFAGPTKHDPVYAVWKITSEAIAELHRSLESCPAETAVAEDPAGLKVSQGGVMVQSVQNSVPAPLKMATAVRLLGRAPF